MIEEELFTLLVLNIHINEAGITFSFTNHSRNALIQHLDLHS